MKIVSILNHAGSNDSRTDYEDTRIIGFKVSVPSIEETHEKWEVTSPELIEVLAIQYLKSKGYSISKVD